MEEEKQRLKEEVRKEVKEEGNTSKDTEQVDELSRRSFLKKIGVGAGIGALTLTPAAANLKLTKDGIFKNGSSLLTGSNDTVPSGAKR